MSTLPMISCTVCGGRGEVEAGITGDVIEYGPTYPGYDWRGNIIPARACYPRSITPNPLAWDVRHRTVWLLETNPVCALWALAICMRCHGTGQN